MKYRQDKDLIIGSILTLLMYIMLLYIQISTKNSPLNIIIKNGINLNNSLDLFVIFMNIIFITIPLLMLIFGFKLRRKIKKLINLKSTGKKIRVKVEMRFERNCVTFFGILNNGFDNKNYEVKSLKYTISMNKKFNFPNEVDVYFDVNKPKNHYMDIEEEFKKMNNINDILELPCYIAIDNFNKEDILTLLESKFSFKISKSKNYYIKVDFQDNNYIMLFVKKNRIKYSKILEKMQLYEILIHYINDDISNIINVKNFKTVNKIHNKCNKKEEQYFLTKFEVDFDTIIYNDGSFKENKKIKINDIIKMIRINDLKKGDINLLIETHDTIIEFVCIDVKKYKEDNPGLDLSLYNNMVVDKFLKDISLILLKNNNLKDLSITIK